jgi:hypothetical protein
MPDEEIKKLLAELQKWCSEKRGRQTEISKLLSAQSVNDWFGGRSVPTLATGLKIQKFLKEQGRLK